MFVGSTLRLKRRENRASEVFGFILSIGLPRAWHALYLPLSCSRRDMEVEAWSSVVEGFHFLYAGL